jgi:hypothetical protein
MTDAPETRGPIARIQVGTAGEIWLDGARTTLEALRPQLALLRERNGVVWYHRTTSGADPAPKRWQ